MVSAHEKLGFDTLNLFFIMASIRPNKFTIKSDYLVASIFEVVIFIL